MADNEVVFMVIDKDSVQRGNARIFTELLMPDVVAPTVNLNGTHITNLMEGYRDALTALNVATDMLAKTAPHGRDYQTRPASVMDAAVRQHAHRMRMLRRLHAEIEQIALEVQDQGEVRAAIMRRS